MTCRHCKHCTKISAKKQKEMPREEKVAALRKNATLNYAIAALWKRMAKQSEAQAEMLAKPIK